MLGKTFKGLTDEMLAWQTERLLELEARRATSGWCYVRPELVVEIAFDGVQRARATRAGSRCASPACCATGPTSGPRRPTPSTWPQLHRAAPTGAGRSDRPGRPGRTASCAARGGGRAARRGAEVGLGHLLAVAGAGGPGDVLVDEGAAEVVGTRPGAPGGHRRRPIFTHDTWTLSIQPAVGDAARRRA